MDHKSKRVSQFLLLNQHLLPIPFLYPRLRISDFRYSIGISPLCQDRCLMAMITCVTYNIFNTFNTFNWHIINECKGVSFMANLQIFTCHWILIMSNLEVISSLIHITSLKQGGREDPQNTSDTSLC